MSDTQLVPYLNFANNTREAMEFYKNVFGGELTLQTFGEAPGTPSEKKDLIMHANLETGSMRIMASDAQPDDQRVAGNTIQLSLVGSDEAALRACFDELSDGGTVTDPLSEKFWGDIFGMVTDTFGIHWMVNITKT